MEPFSRSLTFVFLIISDQSSDELALDRKTGACSIRMAFGDPSSVSGAISRAIELLEAGSLTYLDFTNCLSLCLQETITIRKIMNITIIPGSSLMPLCILTLPLLHALLPVPRQSLICFCHYRLLYTF